MEQPPPLPPNRPPLPPQARPAHPGVINSLDACDPSKAPPAAVRFLWLFLSARSAARVVSAAAWIGAGKSWIMAMPGLIVFIVPGLKGCRRDSASLPSEVARPGRGPLVSIASGLPDLLRDLRRPPPMYDPEALCPTAPTSSTN